MFWYSSYISCYSLLSDSSTDALKAILSNEKIPYLENSYCDFIENYYSSHKRLDETLQMELISFLSPKLRGVLPDKFIGPFIEAVISDFFLQLADICRFHIEDKNFGAQTIRKYTEYFLNPRTFKKYIEKEFKSPQENPYLRYLFSSDVISGSISLHGMFPLSLYLDVKYEKSTPYKLPYEDNFSYADYSALFSQLKRFIVSRKDTWLTWKNNLKVSFPVEWTIYKFENIWNFSLIAALLVLFRTHKENIKIFLAARNEESAYPRPNGISAKAWFDLVVQNYMQSHYYGKEFRSEDGTTLIVPSPINPTPIKHAKITVDRNWDEVKEITKIAINILESLHHNRVGSLTTQVLMEALLTSPLDKYPANGKDTCLFIKEQFFDLIENFIPAINDLLYLLSLKYCSFKIENISSFSDIYPLLDNAISNYYRNILQSEYSLDKFIKTRDFLPEYLTQEDVFYFEQITKTLYQKELVQENLSVPEEFYNNVIKPIRTQENKEYSGS